MRRLYLMSVAGWLFLAQAVSTAFAAGEHGAEESPSLFAGGMWTSFWALVVFLVLLAVLGKFAWKPILQALKNREERIRTDLQTAKNERVEAQRLLDEYKTQLAQAQAQAHEMIKQSSLEAERAREEILAHGQEQGRQAAEQAKKQIDQARVDAIKDLYAQSAKLAGDLAAKILQREVNSEDHRVLIEQGLEELKKTTQEN